MDEFECLLSENKSAVEHFVLFRTSNKQDAEDIFQETCYTAWRHFGDLKDRFTIQSMDDQYRSEQV